MLPKENRICSGERIKEILSAKQLHLSTPELKIVAQKSDTPYPRLAVICSKKIGNAVTRNRWRRRVRGLWLKKTHNKAKNIDFVIIAKCENIDNDLVGKAIEKVVNAGSNS
ncbi:ribonuclease P protein component [candidate division WOR-1 bacterium RIFOXYB2_FULL_48_7]|uniref:Ribonuclease P protein component n=1 Tax=candidate division WOR-1 bacterium RIFOXYB2_FULL_48_7 TaxID=1802583 RepID=A0A1F4TXK3_UNCSA|nr:MAG: ribonuclease P protein component [candidate division WOR-1 bacterium RIFOXYB2_FULL_48_7]